MTIFSSKKLWATLALGCACLLATTAQGQPPVLDAPAGGELATGKEKIRISSQRLVADNTGSQAEFIGQVVARQGETQIVADRLKLFFAKGSDAGKEASAQRLERMVASGNVEIKFDNRLAVAQQAVYITAERVLILKGPGAKITSGANTISGETITFYRAEGRFAVEGGADGRVQAEILPDEKGME